LAGGGESLASPPSEAAALVLAAVALGGGELATTLGALDVDGVGGPAGRLAERRRRLAAFGASEALVEVVLEPVGLSELLLVRSSSST
jgi:hypothetical protein